MIKYVTGDATEPQGDGKKLIAHVCNNYGAWGAGFTAALNRRWKEPEKTYQQQVESGLKLGTVRISDVGTGIFVMNMVAQRGLHSHRNKVPLRYDALETCLKSAAQWAVNMSASIHMPRIGCGLAGGSWDKVEQIIQRTLITHGVDVTVYDLKGTT